MKKYRFKVDRRKVIVTAHNMVEALVILCNIGYGKKIRGAGEEVRL